MALDVICQTRRNIYLSVLCHYKLFKMLGIIAIDFLFHEEYWDKDISVCETGRVSSSGRYLSDEEKYLFIYFVLESL